MGPSAGYTLNYLITVLCVLTVSIGMSYLHAVAFVSDIHIHIYVVMNLLMFYFWIKLTMKIPNYLTIQKPNVSQFYVSVFAAALKPNNFDGKKFHDMTCQDGIVVDCDELLSRRAGEA